MSVDYDQDDQTYLLSFSSRNGYYLSHGQEYLELSFEVVRLSKKDNDLSINSFTLYYAYDIHFMIMFCI